MNKQKTGRQLEVYSCANCGHPVTNVGNLILHIEKNDTTYESSSMCGYLLGNDNVDTFLDDTNRELQRKITDKFGEQYTLWYWFGEIHCRCNRPEITKDSKIVDF